MKKEIGKSYIIFSIEEDELIINKLYVAPEQRQNKLGYKLIDIAIEFAEENNINTLSLCAESDEETFTNEKLIEYYTNYGFNSDGDCSELMTYNI